ncbi:MAG: sulfite exporter TauE/SafE family protein [Bacteroidales bacterium]|nr:sulfite exporter TauE/SafE family protein [Bacteroidales bacterium]
MVGFSEIPSDITIVTGLILGLATSFHCVGMCGPIALSLPLHGDTKAKKLIGGILYNLGRTVTYAIMGLAFGMLGQGLSTLGFQKMVSIIAGTLMIATVFFPKLFKFSNDVDKGLYSAVKWVKLSLKSLFQTKSLSGLFFIGLLNGLLPCGPLYFAVIVSAGTGNVVESVLFMILFGLGTIPLLLAVTIVGNFISTNIRNKVNSFIPVIMVIMGLLFILRGLSLGIPFLSPTDEKLNKVMMKGKMQLEQYEHQHDSTKTKSSSKSMSMGEHEGEGCH